MDNSFNSVHYILTTAKLLILKFRWGDKITETHEKKEGWVVGI